MSSVTNCWQCLVNTSTVVAVRFTSPPPTNDRSRVHDYSIVNEPRSAGTKIPWTEFAVRHSLNFHPYHPQMVDEYSEPKSHKPALLPDILTYSPKHRIHTTMSSKWPVTKTYSLPVAVCIAPKPGSVLVSGYVPTSETLDHQTIHRQSSEIHRAEWAGISPVLLHPQKLFLDSHVHGCAVIIWDIFKCLLSQRNKQQYRKKRKQQQANIDKQNPFIFPDATSGYIIDVIHTVSSLHLLRAKAETSVNWVPSTRIHLRCVHASAIAYGKMSQPLYSRTYTYAVVSHPFAIRYIKFLYLLASCCKLLEMNVIHSNTAIIFLFS